LAAGALDLALDIPLPGSDAIRQTRVSRDRLIVMARAEHPVLRDELTLAGYLSQTHILVSSRRQGWGLEDFELNREGHRRRIGLRCQHYFAACRVVSQTDWLLTMPEQYARIANAQFGNRIFPFPLPTQPLDVHLYWHANVDYDPANQWLRGQCIALLAAGLGT
jgi:DNA-binding transcriptional LysR family regulator